MKVRELYDPEFLQAPQAERLFTWLCDTDNVGWRTETFKIFGREQQTPRLTAWFGDPGINYRYTGLEHEGAGWPPQLKGVRDKITLRSGVSFNFVILNRYRDGRDYMGWHSDAERGAHPQIGSLSLGATRDFRIGQDKDSARSYELKDGALLLFNGFERHVLPKRLRVQGERINLTFRLIA